MGNGDIVVGKAIPKSHQSIAADQTGNTVGPRPAPTKPPQQQMYGAMSQQGDGNRAPSQPQEFVRLVGCRESKVRPPRAPS